MQQEAQEVLLGEREEVSVEVWAAQIQGYRNESLRARGRSQLATTHGSSISITFFETSSSYIFLNLLQLRVLP
jgi:hypothetical protein